MANKICKYSREAMCIKRDCPMNGSVCVCNIIGKFGVCKYEELIDDVKTYTPVECLKKAMKENGYRIDDISEYDAENAIKQFLVLMRASGHLEPIESDKPIDYKDGDEVKMDDISNHPNWEESDKGHDWISYMTLDEKFIVTFHGMSTKSTVHSTDI